MVPLGTLLNVRETVGPDKVMHHNLYPSADINGATLPRGKLRAGDPNDGTNLPGTASTAVRLRMDRVVPATNFGRQQCRLYFPALCCVRLSGVGRPVRELGFT